jgi:hypothetical protein
VAVPPKNVVATKRNVSGGILGNYVVLISGHFEPGNDEANIANIVEVLKTVSLAEETEE